MAEQPRPPVLAVIDRVDDWHDPQAFLRQLWQDSERARAAYGRGGVGGEPPAAE